MGQAQQQPVRLTAVAEHVSALMDGEIAGHELNEAFDAAKSDAGMADWQSYQLIGDALRSEDLLRAESSDIFLQSFAARFESEPHVLAPAAARSVSRHRLLLRPSWVRRVVPTTAVAAAVAAVTWIAVPQLGPSVNPNASQTVVAMAPAPSEAAVRSVSPVVAVSADATMIRDARLDDYLRAHRQAATTGMAMPYIRAAAAQTTQAQDNSKE